MSIKNSKAKLWHLQQQDLDKYLEMYYTLFVC